MRKRRKEGAWPLMSEPSRENVTERLQWMLEKAAKILSKPYPKFTKEEGLEQASDYISGVIRKELAGKFSDEPTKKITGSELDRETDYLWDLVNTELKGYQMYAEEDGKEAAEKELKKSIEDWKKYNKEDAENLERWLRMAIKKL